MKLRMLVVSAIGMIASANLAHPATLSGSLTVDNFFFAYVSTSDSTLGTLVASGADWRARTHYKRHQQEKKTYSAAD